MVGTSNVVKMPMLFKFLSGFQNILSEVSKNICKHRALSKKYKDYNSSGNFEKKNKVDIYVN